MIRNTGLILVGATCLILSSCDSAGSGKAFYKLDFDAALAEAKKQNKTVMIDFGAPW